MMMMDIPPLHVCNALTNENEVLNAKYRKLTRKYKELEKQMLEYKEELLKMHIENKSRGISYAAEQNKNQPTKANFASSSKEISTDKLLVLHNKLLKQYEKETNKNATQGKKMRKLEADYEKLRDNLFTANQQIDDLKKRLQEKDHQLQFLSSKVNARSTPKNINSNVEIMAITKEKNKLLYENKKLRNELKDLDQSFFDEIEDMKYALEQSTKLNSEYEKALKKICKQFGLNYQSLFTKHIGTQRRNVKSGQELKSFKVL